jgi:hypothetical protein
VSGNVGMVGGLGLPRLEVEDIKATGVVTAG